MKNALEIIGLTKEYPDFSLGPIMLALPEGRAMGFVGNNGAGKTTTIQCVAGLLVPDGGDVFVCSSKTSSGYDWKNDIGYVGDAGGFYEMRNVVYNLKFFAQFYKNWSDEVALKLVDRLELPVRKKVSSLSTGNRMKLKIIVAMAHQPKLLLLDEPASGLDPVARAEFMDLLFEFMEREDHSILYSTHIITEISRLCDDFTFIRNGKLTLSENKDHILSKWKSIIITDAISLSGIPGVEHGENEGNSAKIISSNAEVTLHALAERNIRVLQKSEMSMEDIAYYILKRK